MKHVGCSIYISMLRQNTHCVTVRTSRCWNAYARQTAYTHSLLYVFALGLDSSHRLTKTDKYHFQLGQVQAGQQYEQVCPYLVRAAWELTFMMLACYHGRGNNDGNQYNATCMSLIKSHIMCQGHGHKSLWRHTKYHQACVDTVFYCCK